MALLANSPTWPTSAKTSMTHLTASHEVANSVTSNWPRLTALSPQDRALGQQHGLLARPGHRQRACPAPPHHGRRGLPSRQTGQGARSVTPVVRRRTTGHAVVGALGSLPACPESGTVSVAGAGWFRRAAVPARSWLAGDQGGGRARRSTAGSALPSSGRPRSSGHPGRGCRRGFRGRGPWARSGTRHLAHHDHCQARRQLRPGEHPPGLCSAV